MMAPQRKFELFNKVLVPVVDGYDSAAALTAARLIAGEERLLLFGLVPVAEDESLSVGAMRVQELRKVLRAFPEATRPRPRVSHRPWRELIETVTEQRPDLLVLEWPSAAEAFGVDLGEIFSRPPCDVCLVRHPVSVSYVPVRGYRLKAYPTCVSRVCQNLKENSFKFYKSNF